MTCNLFLDFDGVVSDSDADRPAIDRLRPACVRRLDALVRRLDARVIVSSTWRESCPPGYLRALLAHHGYTGEIDSVTPVLRGYSRGAEVRAWIEAHDAWGTPFVILDDLPPGEFHGFTRYLVTTDYDAGLTDADCERAVRIIEMQRAGRTPFPRVLPAMVPAGVEW